MVSPSDSNPGDTNAQSTLTISSVDDVVPSPILTVLLMSSVHKNLLYLTRFKMSPL